MSLLELAREVNLTPRRVASTNGGEYHSPCPGCGGKDRFIIWEQKGRYFCRQCEAKGDAIQFCRDFLNMTFQMACKKLGIQERSNFKPSAHIPNYFTPQQAFSPSSQWHENAKNFVIDCNKKLKKNAQAIDLLAERKITLDTANSFCLGWNDRDYFIPRTQWGLDCTTSEQGKQKIWIPKGLVIPTFAVENVERLKIRRCEWHTKDQLPKYVEISGSMKRSSVYGDKTKGVAVILESEFDAMLLYQEAGDLCCYIAIGGAGKKPDLDTHNLINSYRLILFALDFDEAGKQAFKFWRSTYAHLRTWPVPKGKSPGEAILLGVNLRDWVLNGLRLS